MVRLRICILKFYFTFINLSFLAINLNVHLESSETSFQGTEDLVVTWVSVPESVLHTRACAGYDRGSIPGSSQLPIQLTQEPVSGSSFVLLSEEPIHWSLSTLCCPPAQPWPVPRLLSYEWWLTAPPPQGALRSSQAGWLVRQTKVLCMWTQLTFCNDSSFGGVSI